MSMQDAELFDVYVDDSGKLWRVIAVCRDPTVTVEEVEPSGHSSDPGPYYRDSMIGVGVSTLTVPGTFIRKRMDGSVGGAMWNGFKRIFRKTP